MTGDLLGVDEEAPSLEGVGVIRRGLARLLDMGVLQLGFLLGTVQVAALPVLLEGWFGPGVWAAFERLLTDAPTGWDRLGQTLLALAGITVLHTLSEGLHGSTLGKRIFGITVVSEDGSPASLKAGFKRSLGFLVDQLFFGLVGAHAIYNDPQGQRLGDSWAGTMVVRLGALEPSARRNAGRFLGANTLGLVAAGVVAFAWNAGLIAYGARATADDRIEIVEVVPLPDQHLRPGRPAAFEIKLKHELRSAYRGTVALYVLDGEDYKPVAAPIRFSRGDGPITLTEQLPIPIEPTAPGSWVLRLGVEMYPALNHQAPSAGGGYDLQMLACDSAPRELCVLRGLRY